MMDTAAHPRLKMIQIIGRMTYKRSVDTEVNNHCEDEEDGLDDWDGLVSDNNGLGMEKDGFKVVFSY